MKETIRVEFDFGMYIDCGIQDVVTELPFSAIPRIGEGIAFDVKSLKGTEEVIKSLTDHEVLWVFVKELDWFYECGVPKRVRPQVDLYDEKPSS